MILNFLLLLACFSGKDKTQKRKEKALQLSFNKISKFTKFNTLASALVILDGQTDNLLTSISQLETYVSQRYSPPYLHKFKSTLSKLANPNDTRNTVRGIIHKQLAEKRDIEFTNTSSEEINQRLQILAHTQRFVL